MQTAGIDSRSSAPNAFAGMLATVSDPPWNDDGLAEDVATISYEHALRTHGRSHSGAPEKVPDPTAPPMDSKRLKTASITIRLSAAECAQVRQRAAEAGLTVSAYLRSCALEVESLRAEVKEMMGRLRSSPEPVWNGSERERARQSTVFDRIWKWFGRSNLSRKRRSEGGAPMSIPS